MAKKRRRRIHSMQDLVWDMADDVKEIVRNEFDSKDKDKGRPAAAKPARGEEDRDEFKRAEELDELRDAIHALAVKVTALSADQTDRDPVDRGPGYREPADRDPADRNAPEREPAGRDPVI